MDVAEDVVEDVAVDVAVVDHEVAQSVDVINIKLISQQNFATVATNNATHL